MMHPLMRILLLFGIVCCVSVMTAACSQHADLPEELLGEWRQEDDAMVGLRFEKGEDGALVYFTTGGDDWFGPMPLTREGAGEWRFRFAPIVHTEGDHTTRIMPPRAAHNPEYIMTQHGRSLVRSQTLLATSPPEEQHEPVRVRIEGDQLIAQGLWLRLEVERWDPETFEPVERKLTPLETPFSRLAPVE